MSVPFRRPWLAFFLTLGVLGLIALTIPIVYNLSLQLKPAQLERARALWRENAPSDYDLSWIEQRTHPSGEERDEYFLAVRGGRPVLLTCDGEALYAAPGLALVAGPGALAGPQQDPGRYGVEAMFAFMEEALRHDVSVGGRNYCTAQFDAHDGHPQHFRYRIRGSGERVEWVVHLNGPEDAR